MKIAKKSTWMILCAVVALLAGQAAWAQTTTVPARVVSAVDDTQTVTLKGNVHPLARAEFDQGAVSDATPATRMMLVLQRSAQQETALRQLMDQQQDKTSANYHAWLTPAQFGTQFGPADADVQAVTDWLQSHGFQNVKVGAGRTTIEFSGNVGQLRNAFHTDIHQFLVHGEQHMANVSDPQIPAALAPVLGGVVGLHNFRKKPLMHRMENYLGGHVSGSGPKPQVTFMCGSGPCYGVAPGDFATIYNTTPLISGTTKIDGTGVTIAIVQDSNVYLTDIQQFRNLFGLSNNFTESNIIMDGPDPGVQNTTTGNGDEGEAVLDVEWSGAVAPGATIDLVVSATSLTIGVDGLDLSANYIVQNNSAQILSESFGSCEAGMGSSGVQFYNVLWEQAAAQGITAIVSAGDNGSAMCDAGLGNDYAENGLAINGLASTPFNVALGGTDFQAAGLAGYWGAAGPGITESAISYIPEQTWNSGCASTATAGNLTTCASLPNSGTGFDVLGGGGGQSAFPSVNGRPAWQVGVVPSADTGRDIPDLALFSAVNSSSNVFYITCEQDTASQSGSACSLSSSVSISPVGGTSAAAPAFAGIMALIIQKEGGVSQGNANYVMYQLYKADVSNAALVCPSNTASVTATGCIFYDTVTGNNSVACLGHSTNCSNTSSAANEYGVLVDPAATTTPAFLAVKGYDKGTGLGSVNVSNLAKAWSSASFTADTPTITAYPTSTVPHGSSQNFTVTVKAGSGTVSPTGFVSLIATPKATGSTPVGIGEFTNTSTSTFQLSGSGGTATATITTNILPGGTDSVVAQYGGDGTFAPATSAPVNVTVSQETSVTTVTLWTVSSDGTYDLSIPAGSTIPYGSSTTPYIMRVDVTNSQNEQCSSINPYYGVPCPTGTVTETYNNGLALNDFPNAQTGVSINYATLNTYGFLEDLPINLPGGNDTIVAAYSGDTSYIKSTSTPPFPITISPAATAISASSSSGTVTTGASVTLTALVSTQSVSPVGPTGYVQFYNSGVALGTPVAVTSIGATQVSYAGAAAALNTSFSTAGTESITAKYAGDTNYTASAISTPPVTITVTQGTSGGSYTLAGSSVSVTAGGSGMSTITLTPAGGFTGSVVISCGTAVPGVTCGGLSVTVPSGGGNGTGSLAVNVAAPSTTMTAMNLPERQEFRAATLPRAPNVRSGLWTLSAGTGLAAIFLLFLPGRKRYRAALGLTLMCILSFTLGCGGGSGGGGGGGGTTPTVTHLTVSATKVVAAATTSITVSATVTGGTPTGNVEFLVDGSILGTAPVTNGTTGNITVTGAQAPPFLELVGTHTVSATYLGDATTGASSSGTLYVTATGTTSLPISGNPGASNASPAISLTIN